MDINQLDNRTTNMQIAHNKLVNDLAKLRNSNRADHAKFESNVNLLLRKIKKIETDMEEVMLDRDAMALVVEERKPPKRSLFSRIFK